MSALTEILPDTFSWTWFSERFGYDFNGFLVRSRSGNIAVDPVEMEPDKLEAIVRAGVSRIVLTNRNHYRDAKRLAERTGAPVSLHPADAAFVAGKGVPVAGELNVGDRVGPFTVIGCPGKSPGEVMLHWPERRLLIVGDACVGRTPGVLGLVPPAAIDDLLQLKQSLARVAADVDFDALLVADGHHIFRGARAALNKLLATLNP